MADNTQLNAGSGGDTVRDLDRSGVKTPICALDLNPAGSETLMAGAMPCSQNGGWTVTANAGTNLNTSLLALESGGHLASIDTKTPALGQALAAASVPVVLTAAQLSTLTPVSTVAITGSVAVTGTFYPATQPVSAASLPLPTGASTAAKQPALGTAGSAASDVITVQGITSMTPLLVTASAGTNLNTSALALESGGNLATIAGAVSASKVNVVIASGTVTTVSTVTAVTTVSTVTAVTAITNALPAGTNLLGKVSNAQQVANLYNGTTAVTPQYAPITASSSGATTVVAAVSGKTIYVLRWSLSANGNVNVNWQSHTTTGTATGLHYLTQYASAGGAYCPAGIFATASGEALDINLSASVAVGGELTYVQF